MKKHFFTMLVFALGVGVIGRAGEAAAPGHWVAGNSGSITKEGNMILKGQMPPARFAGIPVRPGTKYRLHYVAVGMGTSGGASLFQNLQINTEPRTEGAFLIQDVRDEAQPAFQNFRVPDHADYDSIDVLFEVKTQGEVKISDIRLEEIPEDPSDAWALTLSAPAYRDTIFATDELRRIAGRVEADASAATLTVTVSNGTKEFARAAIPFRDQSASFDFDAVWPIGNYTVTITVSGTDGKELKQWKRTVAIVPEAPIEIKAAANGFFTINGKYFFPVFYFFEMVDDGLLYQASRNGVNACIMGFNNEAYMLAELDRFQKYGLKGLIYLEQHNHIGDPARFPQFKEDLRNQVTPKIMAHPAFFGYLLTDEPLWKGIPAERVRAYYELVKAHDPYHPIWINEAPRNEIADLRLYADSSDIFGCDIYPVPYPSGHSNLPDRTPSCVGKYTQRMTEVVQAEKPIWMVLQGNSWSDYAPAPETLFRHPSLAELRFMTFDALLNGSHGYAVYTPEKNKSEEFQRDLFAVSRELHNLSGLFVHGTRLADAASSNPAIRCGIYRYDGKLFGVLLNLTDQPQSGSIILPAETEMRTIPEQRLLASGKIELAPFEVVVWGNTPLPDPVWELPPRNAELEQRDFFGEMIRRQVGEREKAWKAAGVTPHQESL